MPKFSNRSSALLHTAQLPLVELFEALIEFVDFSILGCARSEAEQKHNVAAGLSETLDSKHVVGAKRKLAAACDAAPYPQRWNDPKYRDDLLYFSGLVKGFAIARGINLRTGADWNRNNAVSDERFEDLDHFELED